MTTFQHDNIRIISGPSQVSGTIEAAMRGGRAAKKWALYLSFFQKASKPNKNLPTLLTFFSLLHRFISYRLSLDFRSVWNRVFFWGGLNLYVRNHLAPIFFLIHLKFLDRSLCLWQNTCSLQVSSNKLMDQLLSLVDFPKLDRLVFS